MVLPLWVFTVLLTELVVTCMLLRWLPVTHERWMAATPLPAIVLLAVSLRYVAQVPWSVTFAASTGFLWGVAVALVPFRGWVSSWTLPAQGEARLRWREVALVVPAVVTPLSTKGTSAAVEKAFAARQVVRGRGRFPLMLGVALLVAPVTCAMAAGWGADVLSL